MSANIDIMSKMSSDEFSFRYCSLPVLTV